MRERERESVCVCARKRAHRQVFQFLLLQGFVLSGKSLERTFISSLAAAAMTTTVVDSSADSHDGGVAALQAIRYTRGRGLQLLDQVRRICAFCDI